MKPLPLLVAALVFTPLPLAAQTLHDTHDLRWAPSGKAPAASWHYRGKGHAQTAAGCSSAAAPIHLAGKTTLHAAASTARCAPRLALERPDSRIARD